MPGNMIHTKIQLVILLINLFQCNTNMEKYEWFPTPCAPQNYPAEILRGNFILPDGDSIYIPDGALINNGWGEIGTTHLVGEDVKPLPDKLEIIWFSYTEDKFYSGLFELPLDTISRLFKNGFLKPYTNEKSTYRKIMVGVAPEGFVSIWLEGEGVVTEVCNYQAEETNIEWKAFFDNPEMTRAQFVQANLEESLSPEFLVGLRKNGISKGMWQNYQKRYNWMPNFITTGTPVDIWLTYYNGEKEYFSFEKDSKMKVKNRGIVKKMEIVWKSKVNVEYSAVVDMRELEIINAFAKLSEGVTSQSLMLQIQINDIENSLKVSLSNEKYLLDLKDCDIKVYSN